MENGTGTLDMMQTVWNRDTHMPGLDHTKLPLVPLCDSRASLSGVEVSDHLHHLNLRVRFIGIDMATILNQVLQ